MKNIHFISGLPRSGSTLLSAILSQNPDFHASISSPLAQIFNGAWQAMGGQNEGVTFIDDIQRWHILNMIVQSFYSLPENGTRTIFDTSRVWTAKLHLICNLFPDAKIICPVRNVAWIIDSFEHLIRKNYLSPSRMFPGENSLNVFERANLLSGSKGMIGSSYNCLREACFGEYKDRLLLIDYDRFVVEPAKIIGRIYDFIDTSESLGDSDVHDFNNISFPSGTHDAILDFDARLNTPGLHSVRSKIEKHTRQTILPPEIFAAHSESDFWNKPEFIAATGVKVL